MSTTELLVSDRDDAVGLSASRGGGTLFIRRMRFA